MQLSRGVEWATHCCTILAMVPPGAGIPAEALADFFGVPAAYLAKQLQALRRAGIVESSRGKRGGYRLARSVDAVSLLDIVHAVEGRTPAFRCTEIRRNGPCGLKPAECKRPCEIAHAFADAEEAWRSALAGKLLAAIMAEAAQNSTPRHMLDIVDWVQANGGAA